MKTVKQPGCGANIKEKKHHQFEIPSLEADNSEEAQSFINRTSQAIMNKDLRGQPPKLHSDENDEEPANEKF